jgi:predicted type IV restriction endonuclease
MSLLFYIALGGGVNREHRPIILADGLVSDDFRERLVEHSKKSVVLAAKAHNEQATRMFLVMPFLQLLGYDASDPDQIAPEADASFADKFKNKVDYAILQSGEPVIAIETKKVGALSESTKGELKGYFNAMPSVKLGMLTDGLVYELYSDTRRENMMDDRPFVVVALKEIAQDSISDSVFDALLKLRKGTFDPESVGKDAERKLHVNAYIEILEKAFKVPQESLVRTMMDLAKIEGNKNKKKMEEHSDALQEAMRTFFDRKLLERVGFADREDLVRVPEKGVDSQASVPEQPDGDSDQPPSEKEMSAVRTTEIEQQVFDYVRRRLSFLISGNEEMYRKLEDIFMRDRKQVLNVSYKKEMKGKLFGFREGKDPKHRFDFVGSGTQLETNSLSDIDDELLAAFRTRVSELG